MERSKMERLNSYKRQARWFAVATSFALVGGIFSGYEAINQLEETDSTDIQKASSARDKLNLNVANALVLTGITISFAITSSIMSTISEYSVDS